MSQILPESDAPHMGQSGDTKGFINEICMAKGIGPLPMTEQLYANFKKCFAKLPVPPGDEDWSEVSEAIANWGKRSLTVDIEAASRLIRGNL